MKKNIFILILIFLSFSSAADTDVFNKLFESKFSSAVLLGDQSTVHIGFINYDLESLDVGANKNSLGLRNSLTAYSIPYSYKLHNTEHDDKLHFSISYVAQRLKIYLKNNSATFGEDHDQFVNFYTGFSRSWKLNHHWAIDAEAGGILMYYHNTHIYDNGELIDFNPALDGVRYNLDAGSILLKPKIMFTYVELFNWGKWTFTNDNEYFYGWTVAGADSLSGVTPKAWQISNTAKINFNIYKSKFHAESFLFKIQSVLIGGDAVNFFNTRSYYEFGTGILIDSRSFTTLIDNFGLGLNINIGSSLTGGSVVLYYNE